MPTLCRHLLGAMQNKEVRSSTVRHTVMTLQGSNRQGTKGIPGKVQGTFKEGKCGCLTSGGIRGIINGI